MKLAHVLYPSAFVAVFVASFAVNTAMPELVAALSPDSVGFQALGAKLAAKMAVDGMSVWHPAPSGQVPAGLAALFIHGLGGVFPAYAVLNAVLAVLAIVLGQGIVRQFGFKSVLAPFLIFLVPTFTFNFLVVHKDGMHIVSMLAIFWALLYCGKYEQRGVGGLLACVAVFAIGVYGIAYVRPYFLVLILGICLLFALGYAVMVLASRRSWASVACVAVMAGGAVLAHVDVNAPEPLVFASHGAVVPDKTELLASDGEQWSDEPCNYFLVPELRNFLDLLIAQREIFHQIYADGTLNFKDDREIQNYCDAIAFVPVAALHAIMAVDPLAVLNSRSNMAVKVLTLWSVGLFYACFVYFLAGAILSRNRLPYVLMIASFLLVMTVIAYAQPNGGTLLRFRGTFDAVFVAVFLAACLDRLNAVRAAWRRRRTARPVT